jgi:hypothetical protein
MAPPLPTPVRQATARRHTPRRPRSPDRLPPVRPCSMVQRLGVVFAHLTQPCQPSPEGAPGRPAHRPFRCLLGVHSRCGLHTRAVTVFRDQLSEGFRHFVSSMPAPVASAWSGRRVGLAPTGKSAALSRRTPKADLPSGRRSQQAHLLPRTGSRFDPRTCNLIPPALGRRARRKRSPLVLKAG